MMGTFGAENLFNNPRAFSAHESAPKSLKFVLRSEISGP